MAKSKTTSMRPEEVFRAWFVNVMTQYAGAYAQPIESRTTGIGIPDLYAITPKRQPYWAEFKIMKDIEHEIPFEPGQVNWLYNHRACGGVSLVVILVDTMLYIFSVEYVDRMTNKIRHPGLDTHYMLKVPKKSVSPNLEVFIAQLEALVEKARPKR